MNASALPDTMPSPAGASSRSSGLERLHATLLPPYSILQPHTLLLLPFFGSGSSEFRGNLNS